MNGQTWVAVAIWLDGQWCYVKDIWKYKYMSDNYEVFRLYVADEKEVEDALQWYLDSLQ